MADSNAITVTDSDYLRLIIHGVTAFELLRTALEFDLFERLEQADGMTIDDVASAIEVDQQPARILLLGLASLRLLEKRGDAYVNSAVTRRKMLRGSPRFLGPLVDIQAEIINAGIGDFAESMRRNTNVGLRHLDGPGTTLYERLTAHPRLQEIFYANMGDASSKALTQLRTLYDFSDIRHLVDLGGGDGTNSLELVRHHPDLTVTVFDQESVTRLAEARVDDQDLRRRIAYHPGDLFADPFPQGADAILYFHLFEIFSPARNTRLLRKCHAALPAGGVCLVYNFVSDDEGTGSLSAGLVSPYFLALASGEGMTYSPADVERAVLAAGFSRVERHDNLGFSHTLIVGHK
ncbi:MULTISPECIES: methyltransferase [Actinoalloteichus]|uniref:O-methyltransferase n=1 Tax=Actinoalloteichus fjordicus TaxID=1612552 RepID=A0AAC9PSY9_9PSEU|nr:MULTISPECIES: methyltransferase [Actinoalloteichus]APU15530.1 O-methyltransferase [Actinoalloteichus fjordicus]APU21597.1 O-methyltransferase [Actinoalloteichus sp. GBA129-24]